MKPVLESGLVRRNALWNIFGLGLPLSVAVFFIPRLISGLGTDRWGALTLILTFLNYFGLFDLGIGRALTRLLASQTHEDKKKETVLIWTVSAALVFLGALAGAALFLLSPFLASKLIHAQGALKGEVAVALREVGIVLPFLIHSLALRGILEAKRRFDLSNLIRIPVVVFTFGVPILVVPFSHNLGVIVAIILSGRILAWLWNMAMVFRILPHLRQMQGWKPNDIWGLMRMGGWFTVSSIAAPIIDGMDRFFISALLSISMVAYYTTPYELIIKLGINSGGIGGAVFPEFAFRLKRDKPAARALYLRGIKYILAILFPFVLAATVYSNEGLSLWLNPHFATLSGPVLQWLAIFVFLIGAAIVPLHFVDGAGRPAVSALMQLLGLPIQAGLLYFLIKWDGICGAAIACIIRIFLAFLGLLFVSGSMMDFEVRTYGKILVPLALSIIVLLGFHIPMAFSLKTGLFLLVLMGHACVSWAVILEQKDKAVILGALKKTGLLR
jgi:O-antigen/teichoic acid export membrane protein